MINKYWKAHATNELGAELTQNCIAAPTIHEAFKFAERHARFKMPDYTHLSVHPTTPPVMMTFAEYEALHSESLQ